MCAGCAHIPHRTQQTLGWIDGAPIRSSRAWTRGASWDGDRAAACPSGVDVLRRPVPGRAGQCVAWWAGLVVRGALPAMIAVASGWLIAAVTDGEPLTAPLVALAVVFVAAQIVGPLHEVVGSNLGERTATSLNDRLMAATVEPPGVAHLERADLIDDLTMARDFDLGITGPPLSYAMNFIADGFAGLFTGIASAIVLAWYGWWQALLLVLAWSATHWLLRESAIWRDRRTPEVRTPSATPSTPTA